MCPSYMATREESVRVEVSDAACRLTIYRELTMGRQLALSAHSHRRFLGRAAQILQRGPHGHVSFCQS